MVSSFAHTQKTLLSALSWVPKISIPLLLLHLVSLSQGNVRNNYKPLKFHKTNKQTKFPRSHDVSMFYILISLVNTRVCVCVCASLVYTWRRVPYLVQKARNNGLSFMKNIIAWSPWAFRFAKKALHRVFPHDTHVRVSWDFVT